MKKLLLGLGFLVFCTPAIAMGESPTEQAASDAEAAIEAAADSMNDATEEAHEPVQSLPIMGADFAIMPFNQRNAYFKEKVTAFKLTYEKESKTNLVNCISGWEKNDTAHVEQLSKWSKAQPKAKVGSLILYMIKKECGNS